MPPTIDFVANYARSRPGKLACRDLERGASYSYEQLDALVGRWAGWLAGLVQPGDRVGVLSRNRTDVLALQWACVRLGAIFVPFNWRLSESEIAAQAEDCAPVVVLYEDEFESRARACNTNPVRLDTELGEASPPPLRTFAAEDVATLLYTSGTTGRSKGVIFTELNAFYSAFNFSAMTQVGPGSVLLCDGPLFHTIGLYALARTSIQVGATVLFSPRFDPDLTYRRLTDPALGVTHYMCVPQMAEALRLSPGFTPDGLAHLTGIMTGGAPFPADKVRAWAAGGVRLAHGYGMSENGSVMCMPLDPALIERKAEASGLPAPIMEIRLVAADGQDVAPGQIGEIWTRSPAVSPGYWRNEAATVESRSGEWLKTGDVAWRDTEGYYYVCDRLKNMYISGGENVYPAEVEAVLTAHAGVREAAVIGVEDQTWGEVGWAFLVGEASDAELAAHCRSHLAGYKIPKRFVRVEGLPRTASGKIQKHLLIQANPNQV